MISIEHTACRAPFGPKSCLFEQFLLALAQIVGWNLLCATALAGIVSILKNLNPRIRATRSRKTSIFSFQAASSGPEYPMKWKWTRRSPSGLVPFDGTTRHVQLRGQAGQSHIRTVVQNMQASRWLGDHPESDW